MTSGDTCTGPDRLTDDDDEGVNLCGRGAAVLEYNCEVNRDRKSVV